MVSWILNVWKYISDSLSKYQKYNYWNSYVIRTGLSINCPGNASGGIITKKKDLEETWRNVLKNLFWIVYPPIQKNQNVQAEAGHSDIFIILKPVEIALYFYSIFFESPRLTEIRNTSYRKTESFWSKGRTILNSYKEATESQSSFHTITSLLT